MDNRFFEAPVLNSPYHFPVRHWVLDENHQPTQKIIEKRRPADYITPIPKPRKQKGEPEQLKILFDEGKGLPTQKQPYDPNPVINELRRHVDAWRGLPDPKDWQVTAETARLLHHWRHYKFDHSRPFFCQVNHNGQYGRWAFAEFRDVYTIKSDFKDKVETEFNKMIAHSSGEKGVSA